MRRWRGMFEPKQHVFPNPNPNQVPYVTLLKQSIKQCCDVLWGESWNRALWLSPSVKNVEEQFSCLGDAAWITCQTETGDQWVIRDHLQFQEGLKAVDPSPPPRFCFCDPHSVFNPTSNFSVWIGPRCTETVGPPLVVLMSCVSN